jgi:hypothetical protein
VIPKVQSLVPLVAAGAFFALPLHAEIAARGIKDACTASLLLERSGIPSQVVVAGGEAGCIYTTAGVQYLYTTRGSAKINPAHLGQIALRRVPHTEVCAIGAQRHKIRNGCLVFATCAYAGYEHDSHIVWAGIIAAQIASATDGYGCADSPRWNGGMKGHVLTAFETDKREVFIQENGEAPRKDEHLTELAQRGNRSWCDSDTLAYCDHHIQGLTSFKGEFGHPLVSTAGTGSGRPRGSFSDVGNAYKTTVPFPAQYGWGVLLATLGFVAWRRFFARATLLTDSKAHLA